MACLGTGDRHHQPVPLDLPRIHGERNAGWARLRSDQQHELAERIRVDAGKTLVVEVLIEDHDERIGDDPHGRDGEHGHLALPPGSGICLRSISGVPAWESRSGWVPGLTLRDVVEVLREHHGVPLGPPTADPFALILWENVAYLASPARRREAFRLLVDEVGVEPGAILAAEQTTLERVTSHGILKGTFAAKLRACAEIVRDRFSGDLGPIVRGPVGPALRALRAFPGIGVPGAEKVLLFSGRHPFLAPDSNGLRVLARFGFIAEDRSYARMYAAGRAAAAALPADVDAMQAAHLLLQRHGQTLCRNTAPHCGDCPLAAGCGFAARTASEGHE